MHYLKNVGIRMHMNPSRSPSMVLHIKGNPSITLDQAATELIGKTVHVNWPYLWEAKVGIVANAAYFIEFCDGGLVRRPHNDMTWWNSEAEFQRRETMTRRAIDVGDVNVLVEVFPLQGIIMRHDGSRTKWYGETPFLVPYQLVVVQPPLVDDRWNECGTLPTNLLYPVGSSVVHIKQPLAFAVGRVQSVQPTGSLDLVLSMPEA
jgi:5'-3' exonuclease